MIISPGRLIWHGVAERDGTSSIAYLSRACLLKCEYVYIFIYLESCYIFEYVACDIVCLTWRDVPFYMKLNIRIKSYGMPPYYNPCYFAYQVDVDILYDYIVSYLKVFRFLISSTKFGVISYFLDRIVLLIIQLSPSSSQEKEFVCLPFV